MTDDAGRKDTPDAGNALDALMRDFAWAVHDFQRLASAVSLLASSITSVDDDLEEPSFYTDIDLLTTQNPPSAAGQRVADVLTDDDRRALRALKNDRDDLVYRFFLTHKVKDGTVPAGAAEKLAAVHAQVRDGQAILDRLYASMATA